MTTESAIPDVSEAQIEVHWREEDYIPPPPKFVEQANANEPAILDRFADQNFPDCFTEYADLLTWDEPWQTVLDTSNPPFAGSPVASSTPATTASTGTGAGTATRRRCSGCPSRNPSSPRPSRIRSCTGG